MPSDDKHAIEQYERTMKLFNPDEYEKYKARQQHFADMFKPKCVDCGGFVKVTKDSMYHAAATGICETCGMEQYI